MLARRLSAAATVALAALGVLATSSAATAADSKCVALVVDFSHVGGSISSACVTVPTKATGSDVLVAGHHKVTFDPRYGDDFICAIDGVPAGGCHATDDTHYWVYYHRAPGRTAWHVSQEGAGTYKPANTSTEGWVYDDGSSPAPTPRDVPYTSICTKPPPSPSPTHSATSSPSPARSVTASPTSSTTTAHRPASRHSSLPAVVATTSAATPTASPSESAPRTLAVAAHRQRTHHVPLALIVGLVAAVGLGATAVVRMRR